MFLIHEKQIDSESIFNKTEPTSNIIISATLKAILVAQIQFTPHNILVPQIIFRRRNNLKNYELQPFAFS